jgi:hypothetical protein
MENVDFWVQEKSPMKTNFASTHLHKPITDNGISKLMIASDNGFETRAFYQEGMSLTTENILVQSTLSSSSSKTKIILKPIILPPH